MRKLRTIIELIKIESYIEYKMNIVAKDKRLEYDKLLTKIQTKIDSKLGKI